MGFGLLSESLEEQDFEQIGALGRGGSIRFTARLITFRVPCSRISPYPIRATTSSASSVLNPTGYTPVRLSVCISFSQYQVQYKIPLLPFQAEHTAFKISQILKGDISSPSCSWDGP